MITVLLFVITPSFRRRFRPQRQTDELPMRPIVDVILLWMCMMLGGVCGSAALVAYIGSRIDDVTLDPPMIVTIGVMTALAPLFFWATYVLWRRLNR